MLVVRQKFPDRRIADVAGEVRAQLTASGFAARLKPGATVAIGVGSRGINNIAHIVQRHRAITGKIGACSPSSSPPWAATAPRTPQGQADVLANYRITEATMGCPVISQLEVVSLGKTADGIEAFMDKLAYDSDGVMTDRPRQVAHRFRRQDRKRTV